MGHDIYWCSLMFNRVWIILNIFQWWELQLIASTPEAASGSSGSTEAPAPCAARSIRAAPCASAPPESVASNTWRRPSNERSPGGTPLRRRNHWGPGGSAGSGIIHLPAGTKNTQRLSNCQISMVASYLKWGNQLPGRWHNSSTWWLQCGSIISGWATTNLGGSSLGQHAGHHVKGTAPRTPLPFPWLPLELPLEKVNKNDWWHQGTSHIIIINNGQLMSIVSKH